jgi:hypothetical protein
MATKDMPAALREAFVKSTGKAVDPQGRLKEGFYAHDSLKYGKVTLPEIKPDDRLAIREAVDRHIKAVKKLKGALKSATDKLAAERRENAELKAREQLFARVARTLEGVGF